MYPTFNANETQIQEFNPFEEYGGMEERHQFPPHELENMAAGEELPPLEDVSHTMSNFRNRLGVRPFSIQVQDLEANHDHRPYSVPEFNESIKEISSSNSNSYSKPKSAYSELNPPAALELLSGYRNRFKHLEHQSSINEKTPDCARKELSTVEIIELAAEKFIKFSTQRVNGYTMFTHPYGSSAFTSLTIDNTREVELIFQLLTAAEKVGRRQFDTASKFLARCGWVTSDDGSPVERLAYYLSMGTNPTFLACHQALPFNQVLQFTGIQAIIDQIGTSSKVHLIDMHIRSGVQWTAMMQALAERGSQIELMKITAFATTSDVQQVGETGKRLEAFAKTFNLSFLFKILVLSDITEVGKEQFEVQDGEAIAVYCQTILRTMITRPQSLENLMRTIRRINPLIVVVAEVEANHNSTSFVNRFTETLFFYGALFDCLEACMSRDNAHRAMVEGVHLAEGMHNMVADEGGERISRSVNMNTWRSFFARFGMIEIDLSDSCMYQANLVLQQFSCASSCTLENNGKCLIVGWKGTPLHSLSTWKFIQE
ncbi:Transcription factor GRAS [Cynara cardunculus var. scolymus]|uniref:Transcription factor GRAS n=1 Tax=Cynara cardunculus var. scolymus TaxID=59895 RepID=A0A103XM74_CYNCS|nr:Transcription factor GRAS [Cynara cardunculus var. scolymus]